MHKPARSRRAVAAAGLAALALLPLGAVAGTAGPADAATGRHFANCTALHKVWHYGVAKGPKAARKQVRDGYHKPAAGPKARKVYWANYKSLDRDKDGTACEA
jgi:hypothetical protein